MRVLVQRVSRAAVRVAGETVGAIERGLLVFVGVERGDGPDDVDYQADKTAGLRIFPDDAHNMKEIIIDVASASAGVSVSGLSRSR